MSDPRLADRVVVRPPNWLGDAILALPAMAAIRSYFYRSELTIAAAPSVAAIFREVTEVRPDRVIDLAGDTGPAVKMLAGGHYDLGILFPNSFRSAYQFWRAKIAERWGYPTSARGLLLTRRSRPSSRLVDPHQSDYYRRLVEGLGITSGVEALPRIAPTSGASASADAILAQHGIEAGETLVGVAPGAAYGQAKQWPPDRMAAVAARVVRASPVRVVIVGATHDRDAARAIESWLRAYAPDALPRVVNLTGRTSLSALIGILNRVSAFLSNDSGAMHLAAAAGRYVVAVFGPTNERATRPLGDTRVITHKVFCRPCMLRDCPIDHRCMKGVSVDEVYGALAGRLPHASLS
jgi:heptosyltransferase-2